MFKRIRTFLKRFTDGPLSDVWYYPVGNDTISGFRITEETAMKYATYFACVSLLAEDIGKLPIHCYRRRADGGKDRVTDHSLVDTITYKPNSDMISLNWVERMVLHLLNHGNSYDYIDRNARGKMSLWPIHPSNVTDMERVNGKIVYTVNDRGREQKFPKEKIFHIVGFGGTGLKGKSKLQIAAESIGLGVSAEQFNTRFFSNGVNPSMAVVLPPEAQMDPEGIKKYAAYLKNEYSGVSKSHGILVLGNGETVTPMTVNLKDAQFLEIRNFQKLEICGLFHIPPHKIAIHGNNADNNSLEQENASYADTALMPIIRRIEQHISAWLISPQERRNGLFFEFLLDALLRADSQARTQYYKEMWQMGVMSDNDIRAKENMNPKPNGGEYYVPMNFVPEKYAGKMFEGQDTEKLPTRKRSIYVRDRIVSKFKPLIRAGAEKIVNRETIAIKRQVEKLKKDRAAGEDFNKWLDAFYRKLPIYIRKTLDPVFRSFAESIKEVAEDEMDGTISRSEFDLFVKKYMDTYIERHIGSSRGQMESIIKDEDATIYDIEARADEWDETRADKVANNESTRLSNATYTTVIFAGGYTVTFRNRGPSTCPYCQKLNGRRIRKGETLVKDGDEIKVGTESMKMNGDKIHAPIHQGCDCYMSM